MKYKIIARHNDEYIDTGQIYNDRATAMKVAVALNIEHTAYVCYIEEVEDED